MKRKHYLFLALLCVGAPSFAQKTHAEKQFSKKPLWIDMMKDTAVNFFAAEKAFNTYWANHELPKEENESGEANKNEEKMSRRERKELHTVMELSLDVKKYMHWRESVLPWVLDDGRIRSQAERLTIWKAQQTQPGK